MSAISSGIQTPTFKAFIDIPAEKSVAGFGSDKKPIASSDGLKGLLVKLYNSIATALSSTFASHKADQGAAAHQAFIGSLKNEYGSEIGEKVTRRCGLDTALASKQQLSGQVIKDAFNIAESLQRTAKFEQGVLQTTAFNDNDRFKELCRDQKVNPETLSNQQRETFDDLVRGSGLVNRDTGSVGDKAPNVSLLMAAQQLAIRLATLPATAFNEHIGTAMAAVDLQETTGEIDPGEATTMRDALVAAGRKMAFATGVHALGVGEFLTDVYRSGSGAGATGQLTRDLLVLAKTQSAVLNAMTDIRSTMGKTSEFGADELAVINETAFNKALSDKPTATPVYREMQQIAFMAQSANSSLCRTEGVLFAVIGERIKTSDQNGQSGGVPQRGAASAWAIANTLVGLACEKADLSSDDIRRTAFTKGEGANNFSTADTAAVLEHVNKFIKF